MSAVEFKDVVKIYGKGEGRPVAVDHVSLTIEKGEFVVILGQSGAGKLVIDLLQRLSTEQENTVILVTHNADIAKCANRVIHMRNGKIKSIKTNYAPLSVNDIEW